MSMKSALSRFSPAFLLAGLCLFVVLSLPFSPLAASEEYPTINELMKDENFEKELTDEPPIEENPEHPEYQPPEYVPPEGGEETTEPAEITVYPADDEDTPAPAAETQEQVPPPPPLDLAQKVVLVGRVPFMNIKAMMALYQGLVGFLRTELGVKDVQIVTGKDYADVLDALEKRSIDFAWLGPMAYVIGSEKMSLIPLAQAKRRSGATYRGVFITRRDSNILGIEDIKGKVIGFVDPESASGYLYPLYFLHRSKINPHKECKKVLFLHKHDEVLAAVWSKKIDVGVCLEDTLLNLKDKQVLDQIMILGKTYEVPSDVIVCRSDCHPTLRDAFHKALMKTRTLKQTANPTTGLPPILQFLPVNDKHLDTVKGVFKVIKNLRQR